MSISLRHPRFPHDVATVCRLAYGFEDRDPISDVEIAEELGGSRATTQRTRTRALDKMRFALGVA